MTDPSQNTDYYDLLSIGPTATETEIRRAYRKTSILYHPDKAAPTVANLEKFHLLQQALNTLTTPEDKAKYDQARDAKQRRQAETEALDARRRGLKEELERAEAAGQAAHSAKNGIGAGVNGGQKRTWSEREVKIQQIKEENRRRMAQMKARRAREAEEARERVEARKREKEKEESEAKEQGASEQDQTVARSVKVRWVKEGDGLDVDAQAIEGEFAAGEVEHVVILKDKRRRVEGRREKVTVGTAVVVFTTIGAAEKAVQKGPWDGIESVGWANDEKGEPS